MSKNFQYKNSKDILMQDFFTKGYCRIPFDGTDKVFKNFANSTLGKYLEFYYGELQYFPQGCQPDSGQRLPMNFITVYTNGAMNELTLVDAMYCELYQPEEGYVRVGDIIPLSLAGNQNDFGDFDPHGSPMMRELQENGAYVIRNFGMPEELKEIVDNTPFVVQDDECCPDYCQARNHSNDFMNGSPYPEGDKVSEYIFNYLNENHVPKMNRLIRTAVNRTLRLNQTRKGHLLDPHVDTNQSCPIAAIYYSTKGPVKGRQLQIFVQDPQDEYDRCETYLAEHDYLYVKQPYILRLLQEIPIEDDMLIIINNCNPRFVHGHPKQKSEEPVRSIVVQCGHDEVPKNNKLNLLKKLGDYV